MSSYNRVVRIIPRPFKTARCMGTEAVPFSRPANTDRLNVYKHVISKRMMLGNKCVTPQVAARFEEEKHNAVISTMYDFAENDKRVISVHVSPDEDESIISCVGAAAGSENIHSFGVCKRHVELMGEVFIHIHTPERVGFDMNQEVVWLSNLPNTRVVWDIPLALLKTTGRLDFGNTDDACPLALCDEEVRELERELK